MCASDESRWRAADSQLAADQPWRATLPETSCEPSHYPRGHQGRVLARDFAVQPRESLAAQGQLSKELRDAVTANARSRLVFQCNQDDATQLSRQAWPA